MVKKETLISRHYFITRKQDKFIKKTAIKKGISDAQVVRDLLAKEVV